MGCLEFIARVTRHLPDRGGVAVRATACARTRPGERPRRRARGLCCSESARMIPASFGSDRQMCRADPSVGCRFPRMKRELTPPTDREYMSGVVNRESQGLERVFATTPDRQILHGRRAYRFLFWRPFGRTSDSRPPCLVTCTVLIRGRGTSCHVPGYKK
jgi:hypothetical protein